MFKVLGIEKKASLKERKRIFPAGIIFLRECEFTGFSC